MAGPRSAVQMNWGFNRLLNWHLGHFCLSTKVTATTSKNKLQVYIQMQMIGFVKNYGFLLTLVLEVRMT